MEEKKFCKFCGEKIDKLSIVCSKCGRQLQIIKKTEQKTNEEGSNKIQSKFYEQQWFMWVMLIFFAPVGIFLMWKFNNTLKHKTKIILSVVFGIVFLITMFGGNEENKKIVWDDIELKDKLPMPETLSGEININRSDLAMFDITKISKNEYKAYVEECRDKGYTIDLEYDPWDDYYDAFNKEGYSLRVIYHDYNEEMSITLESPKQDKMKEIEWPSIGLGALLPKPKSTFGNIILNNSDTFTINIGNMNISDYDDYVKQCENEGYINNFTKDEKKYSATNSKGYKVNLMYLGANVIEISLNKPEDDSLEMDNKNNGSNEDISYNFKKAMDDYENFMDEYISFMKKYKDSNGTDTSLLKDYTKYLGKYSEMLSSFEKWEDKVLNRKESKYYLEVQTRVNKKLLEVSIN